MWIELSSIIGLVQENGTRNIYDLVNDFVLRKAK